MLMLRIQAEGDFTKTIDFLERAKRLVGMSVFDKYGKIGVEALRSATPKDTGETANSWYYEINREGNKVTIDWLNRNVNDGVNIAVIIQYGHGTGTGGYVRGIDYINPAMKPVFDKIADDLWREVTR
ncbi:HK97 gp10 family phage protein [Turicimonas muris]|uniref:HK97 gp10 family phage protein n=2 Tax=Turicimonas muris TaxID=1796652 RepID=UPI00260B9736|nr:HK97 gp10 family phage protein [Turicimonas muris]